jgi:hypothetical protein
MSGMVGTSPPETPSFEEKLAFDMIDETSLPSELIRTMLIQIRQSLQFRISIGCTWKASGPVPKARPTRIRTCFVRCSCSLVQVSTLW